MFQLGSMTSRAEDDTSTRNITRRKESINELYAITIPVVMLVAAFVFGYLVMAHYYEVGVHLVRHSLHAIHTVKAAVIR